MLLNNGAVRRRQGLVGKVRLCLSIPSSFSRPRLVGLHQSMSCSNDLTFRRLTDDLLLVVAEVVDSVCHLLDVGLQLLLLAQVLLQDVAILI